MKKLQTILGAAAIMAPISIAISCSSNKETKTSLLTEGMKASIEAIKKSDNDTNPIVDKSDINLVSLGDSISAGFTALDTSDHRGFMDESSKKISGFSYGSYLARAFKEKSKLKDFHNFGIGGWTTATLRNQVDPTFKLSEKEDKIKEKFSKLLVIPKEKKRFTKISDKLKKANLITISIGANDILGKIKIAGLTLSEMLKNGLGNISLSGGMNSLLSYDKDEFNDAINVAKENLLATLATIKKMNSKAKIILVGYPMPFTQLASIFAMAKDKEGRPLNETLLKRLDEISSWVANKFETVDYIDTYTKETWGNNALKLAPEIFDIHPAVRGYRVMAATILANLEQKAELFQDNKFSSLASSITKKRLVIDYKTEIDKYMDTSSTLSTEEQALESMAKPYKLVHFVAQILPKLGAALASPSTPLTISPEKILSPTPNLAILGLIPFVKEVLISANMGLESTMPAKVKTGVELDIKFIYAKLIELGVSKMGQNAKNIIQALILGQIKKLSNVTPIITKVTALDLLELKKLKPSSVDYTK